MKEVVLLYMPVIHRGYLDFLERHAGPSRLCLLIGKSALTALGPEVDYVSRKDAAIRALPESIVLDFVRSRRLYEAVQMLDPHTLPQADSVIRPDEDVTNLAAKQFFPAATAVIDLSRLRYDRVGAQREDPVPAAPCTTDELARVLMGKAAHEAARSKDWWLSVGALIAHDGTPILIAHNEAALDADLPNIMGDPRSAFSRGMNTDDTLVLHAERRLVAQAAFLGISLMGADAYVTHFPCVPCGEGLIEAGIKRLFFSQGYSRLESAELFLAKGVELFQVI